VEPWARYELNPPLISPLVQTQLSDTVS